MFTEEFIKSCYMLGVNPFAAMDFPKGTKFIYQDRESSKHGAIVIFHSPAPTSLAALCSFEGEVYQHSFLPYELKPYEPTGTE